MDPDDGMPRLPLARDTISWEINADPAPMIGSSTALLLQVAHPLVAAGVAQHSNYRSDPFSRLYRTLDTVLKVVFGTPDQVRQMERRMASRHRTVVGEASDGTHYDARQSDLGLWVWATLVHTAMLSHELTYGRRTAEEHERYYREAMPFAVASGVDPDDLPRDWNSFLAYYDRVIAEDLERTPECLDVADSVFRLREPPVVGRIAGWVLKVNAAGLMPARAREIYGLRWTDTQDRWFRRWMRLVGRVLGLLPRRARSFGAVAVIDHEALTKLESWQKRQRAKAKRRRREREAA